MLAGDDQGAMHRLHLEEVRRRKLLRGPLAKTKAAAVEGGAPIPLVLQSVRSGGKEAGTVVTRSHEGLRRLRSGPVFEVRREDCPLEAKPGGGDRIYGPEGDG